MFTVSRGGMGNMRGNWQIRTSARVKNLRKPVEVVSMPGHGAEILLGHQRQAMLVPVPENRAMAPSLNAEALLVQ